MPGEPKRIVFVGEEGVGKTSFLSRLTANTFSTQHLPTIEDVYNLDEFPNLDLVDTAGSAAFDRLRPFSYTNASISVLCFSVLDKYSFTQLQEKWIPEVKYYMDSKPLWILGLKTDALQERVVSEEEVCINLIQGRAMAKSIPGCKGYFECESASRFNNVHRSILLEILKVPRETVVQDTMMVDREKEGRKVLKYRVESDSDFTLDSDDETKSNSPIRNPLVTEFAPTSKQESPIEPDPITEPVRVTLHHTENYPKLRKHTSDMNFITSRSTSLPPSKIQPAIRELPQTKSIPVVAQSEAKKKRGTWNFFFGKRSKGESSSLGSMNKTFEPSPPRYRDTARSSTVPNMRSVANLPKPEKTKKGFFSRFFKN
jgi:small GTP-binding protein